MTPTPHNLTRALCLVALAALLVGCSDPPPERKRDTLPARRAPLALSAPEGTIIYKTMVTDHDDAETRYFLTLGVDGMDGQDVEVTGRTFLNVDLGWKYRIWKEEP